MLFCSGSLSSSEYITGDEFLVKNQMTGERFRWETKSGRKWGNQLKYISEKMRTVARTL